MTERLTLKVSHRADTFDISNLVIDFIEFVLEYKDNTKYFNC